MKLSHAHRAMQDGWVIVESSDKTWSSGGKKSKLPQYTCHWEPYELYKEAKKISHQKMSPPGRKVSNTLLGRTTTNSFRKNEAAGPKWKQHSVVDVSGDESKIQCCKEQYCIGTWNARSMNQGKLDVVKQEMAKSKHQHLRNQWTKMDGRGRI